MNRTPKHSMDALAQWVDHQCSRRSHVRVETADGLEGFVLFGGFSVRHRFAGMYLPDSSHARTHVRVHSPATAEVCRRLAERYGLVVFCSGCAPPGLTREVLRLPVSIDMDREVPKILEGSGAPWSRSARSNITRVKRSGFGFDVVKVDTQSIAAFHRSMLQPSMRSRHGRAASFENERVLVERGRACGTELLRIWQNGRWVAATIAQSTAAGYRLLKMGWLGGDEELLKNGVLCHKAYWGAQFARDSRDFGDFQLLLAPSSPACLRFLRRHSLVVRGTGGDFIVFSGRMPDNRDIAPGLLNAVARWYTWRDTPLSQPQTTAEEVPSGLRPWLVHVPLGNSR